MESGGGIGGVYLWQEKPKIGAEFKGMSSVDLQHACQARGLNSDGTKAQLVRKLTVKF